MVHEQHADALPSGEESGLRRVWAKAYGMRRQHIDGFIGII